MTSTFKTVASVRVDGVGYDVVRATRQDSGKESYHLQHYEPGSTIGVGASEAQALEVLAELAAIALKQRDAWRGEPA